MVIFAISLKNNCDLERVCENDNRFYIFNNWIEKKKSRCDEENMKRASRMKRAVGMLGEGTDALEGGLDL